MKKVLSLILALVLCLSVCACSVQEPVESAPETTVHETTIPETTEAPKSKIGDTVSTDIVEVVLLNVAYEKQYTDVIPKDGYSFVVVDFSLKNIGKTDLGFFSAVGGGTSIIPGSIVWVEYNDGYTFALDDVVGKNGQTYDDSCFDSPNTYISDLKPLSAAVNFQVAICVPNEVIENTSAPLFIKFNLLTSAGETEIASYSVR